ncbi:MAG TPA: cytochrome d ubiquinol oxidase subunit II [Planctomycetota bacterium]|jgi:cytochrome d ubiquinol oxidase subunit II|nr:cytochrome d ubiquinol oxidase subunit II [Planctomycetota bacterium]
METLWFCLVALALTAYVVLDGYDLGAGMLQLIVARTPSERAAVIRSIGPVWDGNEVWLIAAGGTIFAVFPLLYATAFSGFYLPLMMVLWLLVGRALGIEFRHQSENVMWTSVWDVIFSLASAALALFFGVALGNVARGVPIGADGTFFEPLWTDFSPSRATGILDPYTLMAGLTATAALALHGALWIAHKTEGELRERARRAARVAGWAALGLTALLTLWTRVLQPHLRERFAAQPWGYLFPLIAIGGLVVAQYFRKRGRDLIAFAGSSAYLTGMMVSVAFSLYPYVLPSCQDPARGLTVWTAAAERPGLGVALAWWLPGMALAVAYSVFVHRKFAGKVPPSSDHY